MGGKIESTASSGDIYRDMGLSAAQAEKLEARRLLEVECEQRAEAEYLAHQRETEAWKVAQLAATIWAGNAAGGGEVWSSSSCVANAVELLTEARRQVAIMQGSA